MKIIVTIALWLSASIQNSTSVKQSKANGIYLSDKDYVSHTLTNAFNKTDGIKFKENSGLSISINSYDSSVTYFFDEIWGYRRDDKDWRIFNESAYQIEYVGKICLYSTPVCVACLTTAPTYFSIDLRSPLHILTKKNLRDVFHTNEAFVRKLNQLPWTTSIEKRGKGTHNYQFIDWL